MISDFLQNILLLIATGLNLLLTPLDNFIGNYIPQLDNVLNTITGFFAQLGNVSSWVVSFFGLYDVTLSLIVAGLIAPVMISIVAFPIKLGINWYRSLKL